MKVIAILNQKGGSGKTTLATHLTRVLQLSGADVLLVDSDPQGSARDWAAMSEDQPVQVLGIDRPTLARDLQAVAHKDYVVIDGAPRNHDLTVAAIKTADLILIPVQPSPYDIWATSDLVDAIAQRVELTDGQLQAAFVVSRAIKGTRLSNEVNEALGEYPFPVLNTQIIQRVIYPGSAGEGTTVVDKAPTSDAAAEIRALADEITELLK